MERGREFHVSTTLLKKEYLKTFVLAYLIFRVNLSLCLNEKRSVSLNKNLHKVQHQCQLFREELLCCNVSLFSRARKF